MPLMHSFLDFIAWLGWYIVPFILIMNGIVFFHELGHYLVGRWCGVKIEAFSLGFGPELAARVDPSGTRWRLALFPLGGYVKFLGDANAASGQDEQALAAVDPADRGRTLAGAAVYNRAAIVAAGPTANFILAIVLFTGLFLAFGPVEPQRPRSALSSRIRRRRARASRPATSSPPLTASRSSRSRICSRPWCSTPGST